MKNKTSITITWTEDDIRRIAPLLNDLQCREIMLTLSDNYKPEIGINEKLIKQTIKETYGYHYV